MQWVVLVDPIASGESCTIEIVNLLEIIVLEDILFGDVWFCSGQSNMGWAMLGLTHFLAIFLIPKILKYINIMMLLFEIQVLKTEQKKLLPHKIIPT